MLLPNLPKVNITNGYFEPTLIIEYNKIVDFTFDNFQLREKWANNSITLSDELETYLELENECCIRIELEVELKEDGLYVSGKDLDIEDGEHSIGYSFKVEQELLLTSYPAIRQIEKGTIYTINLHNERNERGQE